MPDETGSSVHVTCTCFRDFCQKDVKSWLFLNTVYRLKGSLMAKTALHCKL